jgi:sugar phosphate isomerase/epimerase
MIYFGQIDDLGLLAGLLSEYQAGLESYAFGTSAALDDLPLAHQSYTRDLQGLAGYGLALHGPFFDLNPAAFDSLVREATRCRFESCYQAARQLGADKIIFHSGFCPQVYWEETWRNNSILFWREFLADKDDSIALHLENCYEESFSSLAQVIDEVDHPAFTACLDLGHAHVCSQLPLKDWLKGLGDRIGHLHLHDNHGVKDEHLALGAGCMDLQEVLELALADLPRASWTLELQTAEAVLASVQWLDRQLPGWNRRQV